MTIPNKVQGENLFLDGELVIYKYLIKKNLNLC